MDTSCTQPDVTVAPCFAPVSQTLLVDITSASEVDLERTKEQMKEADVICVVYAVNNVESRNNLRSRWLNVIVNELGLKVRRAAQQLHLHSR